MVIILENSLIIHCVNRPNTCVHCPKLDRSGFIVSHSNGRKYRTKVNISCQTENDIYGLTCTAPNCGTQYVEQPKNRIMDRFNGHISDIRLSKDTTVARHMATHGVTQNPPAWMNGFTTVTQNQ